MSGAITYFQYGTDVVIFDACPDYPFTQPEDSGQSGIQLASGRFRVETVGAVSLKEYFLNWSSLSKSEVDATYNFLKNVVNWSAIPFSFSIANIDVGSTSVIVKPGFIWNPQLIAYNKYSLQITLQEA